MIFLFDSGKKIIRGISTDDFTSALQIEVLNGLYRVEIEIPMFKQLDGESKVTNVQTLFENVEFVGHFDHKDDFQMYRIIEPTLNNSILGYTAVHIFFDEAKSGALIHDRRWRSTQAHVIAKDVFAYIGWELTDYDNTISLDFNVFRETPTEARANLIKEFNVEFDPYLEFDGKEITRKCFRMKKKIGTNTHQRFDYGDDLLKIIKEEDHSGIITAVVGRGRGEEVGDGYGQRIEFDSVVWSKANGDPVDKPAGQNYIEIPEATQQYGYVDGGKVKPRIGVVEFDDVEDRDILIQKTYEWLLENCTPKAVFEADVFNNGHFNLGDTIGIYYKEAGIVRQMRVAETTRNLKNNKKTRFKIGDYQHFFNNSVTRKNSRDIVQIKKDTNRTVTRLNEEFDKKMEQQTGLIEAKASEVKDYAEAEVRTKVEAHREDWIIKNSEIDSAISKITGDVGSLDTGLTKVNRDLSSGLETVNQNLLKKLEAGDLQPLNNRIETTSEGLEASLRRIGTVEGGLTSAKADIKLNAEKLESTFQRVTQDMAGVNGKIDNLKVSSRNLISKSNVSEHAGEWKGFGLSSVSLTTDEHLKGYLWIFRTDVNAGTPVGGTSPSLTMDAIAGREYVVRFKGTHFRNTTPDMVYMYLMNDTPDSVNQWINPETLKRTKFSSNVYSDEWIFEISFVADFSGSAHLLFGTRTISAGDHASFYIKEPMLVEGTQITGDWTPAPEDFDGAISTLTEEIGSVRASAEGFSTDFGKYKTTTDGKISTLTGEVSSVKSTASGLTSQVGTLKGNVDDLSKWRSDKGSLYDQTADKVQQSVWKTDIENLNIGGRNLLRNSSADELSNVSSWREWQADRTRVTIDGKIFAQARTMDALTFGLQPGYHVGDRFEVVEGRDYIISFEGYTSLTALDFDYVYLMRADGGNQGSLNPYKIEPAPIAGASSNKRYYFKVTANWSSKEAYLLIGSRAKSNWADVYEAKWIRFRNVQITEGTKEVPYSKAPEDYLMKTDFVLRSDGFLLGGNYVGGEHYSTAIVGDSKGLKLLGDNIDVSGNLNVKGRVDSWSVNAVTANVGKVFTDTTQSRFIKAKHVEFDTAFINALVTKTAFIDNAQIKASNIRDLETISLTSEQVRVGFNNIGDTLKLTPTTLDVYSNGSLVSEIGRQGQRFFREGVEVGRIGTSVWNTNRQYRGLAFNLTNNADYMAWGHDDNDDGVFTAKLEWHATNTVARKGFSFGDHVTVLGHLNAWYDITGRNVFSKSTVEAGERAKMQSTTTGVRLSAGENTWLHVSDTGLVTVVVNGTTHTVYRP